MKYKLVCFDVDGTLIDNIIFSWQLFHDYFKTDKKKREATRKKFFEGRITYLEWATHDMDMWIKKGAKRPDFFKALEKNDVKLMQGARYVLDKLKEKGIKLAIISGSLNIVLEHALPDYKGYFQDIFLSWMHFDEEGNIKNIEITGFDMQKKAEALELVAKKEGIPLSECVFVGDHHNDIGIAKKAGLSIAFDAKDQKLKDVCDVTIEKKDLKSILPFILEPDR